MKTPKNIRKREHGRHNLRKKANYTIPILLLLLFLTIISSLMVVYHNNSIELYNEVVTIVGLPKELEGLSIASISDLNGKRFGDEQSSLIEVLKSTKYDVLVMSGDMVGRSGDPEPLYELIEGLGTSKPIIFISGNSDPPPYSNTAEEGSVLADYIMGAKARGAIYLDAPYAIKSENATLWFSPEFQMSLDVTATEQQLQTQLELDTANKEDSEAQSRMPITQYRLDVMHRLQDASEEMKEEDVQVSVVHCPLTEDFIRTIQSWSDANSKTFLRSVDLILAGHYNGGQWRLPKIGALYIPAPLAPRGGWFPDQSDVWGLKKVNGVNLYTGRGLGASSSFKLPAFRLFNTPQITVLKLTSNLR